MITKKSTPFFPLSAFILQQKDLIFFPYFQMFADSHKENPNNVTI